ncbi:MAG: [LysW]-aminoadipate kinase [Candidatus Promineifilaceae bacterium]|nr:[LysW]-aminoadipate kinase [Candidatus Promineifilaceae bacterium]
MIVVKVGGGEGVNLDAVCDDVVRLIGASRPLVLVHGGSQATNELATALDHAPRFITSPSGYTSRYTDRRTLEIFEMAYCGRVNKGIVERLQARGVNAIGLSGLDGGLWRGPRKRAIRAVMEDGRERVVRDSLTGRVERVNVTLLCHLLDDGYLPVLTPPALSDDGQAINVDGDRAAAATAAALGAAGLLILSNVAGVLRDYPDERTLISTIPLEKLEDVAETAAEGRMRIKLLGAREALEGGVERVVIGDARGEGPIRAALAGQGTVIRRQT